MPVLTHEGVELDEGVVSIKELETTGYTFKVGDVYSHPMQKTHFRIKKILHVPGENPFNAYIFLANVRNDDYSKRVYRVNYPDQKDPMLRAWYVNDYFALMKSY